MDRKEMFTNFVVGSTTDYDRFNIVASNGAIKKSNVAKRLYPYLAEKLNLSNADSVCIAHNFIRK